MEQSGQQSYAGIGSRKTPESILAVMRKTALYLAQEGWHLRSGGADGADTAFAQGALLDTDAIFNKEVRGQTQIYLAKNINSSLVPYTVYDLAREHSYKFDTRSPYIQHLMLRNVQIIMGEKGDNPVRFVVCWTPNGKDTGGTGVGVRLAAANNIPVYNLRS